ncbi:LysR family transcriptional regulator [Shewanella canadensis]|uniref:LysR family transcriptional regulator n=1 Tax=Shewanella canadensis TaxID=271096 RepID=A0A3S0KVE5_9GAMM|nr:LysR family transcriptional regulator [Shewanella canadensis]RTR38521.1 LysR family transcriptional regulator [Shewanella canadensis]
MKTRLDEFDLNLLRILRVLVATKSTQKTAEQLNISQTTVSRALSRLRSEFGEQLFLRKAHGVEPSFLAYKLAQACEDMLTPISHVVETYRDFSPSTYGGRISLLINTYLLEVFSQELVTALTEAFPKASLELDYWKEGSLEKVCRGEVDYCIQFQNYGLPQELHQTSLFSIRNTLLFAGSHPAFEGVTHLGWEELAQHPIVQLLLPEFNERNSLISQVYKREGYEADIRLKTHSLKTACYYLTTRNAIMIGSEYITELYPELRSCPLPVRDDALITMNLVGSFLQTRRSSPLHQAINSVIQSCFSSLHK